MSAGRAIRLASLKIWLGQKGGKEAALRALKQGSMDVGVLQENNLTKGKHTVWRGIFRLGNRGGD